MGYHARDVKIPRRCRLGVAGRPVLPHPNRGEQMVRYSGFGITIGGCGSTGNPHVWRRSKTLDSDVASLIGTNGIFSYRFPTAWVESCYLSPFTEDLDNNE